MSIRRFRSLMALAERVAMADDSEEILLIHIAFAVCSFHERMGDTDRDVWQYARSKGWPEFVAERRSIQGGRKRPKPERRIKHAIERLAPTGEVSGVQILRDLHARNEAEDLQRELGWSSVRLSRWLEAGDRD